ncbi:MAG: hypothetical protein ACKOPM_01800 [Novosphingobium sp.]
MEQFSIGRVLSRGFGLVRDTLGSVGVFILIIVVIQSAVSLGAQLLFAGDLQLAATSTERFEALQAVFATTWYWAVLLVTLIGFGLSYAGGIHGLIQQAERGTTSLQECLRAGFARMLPVIGLTILWWLGVALGWLFLVVPALILMSMWAVALPAMIAENRGVFESFGRSRELTRGYRLSIFGVLFIVLLIYYAVVIVLVGALLGGSGMSILSLGQATVLSTALSVPAAWISSMLFKAIMTSLYIETVLVKEGMRTDGLTEVFE